MFRRIKQDMRQGVSKLKQAIYQDSLDKMKSEIDVIAKEALVTTTHLCERLFGDINVDYCSSLLGNMSRVTKVKEQDTQQCIIQLLGTIKDDI